MRFRLNLDLVTDQISDWFLLTHLFFFKITNLSTFSCGDSGPEDKSEVLSSIIFSSCCFFLIKQADRGKLQRFVMKEPLFFFLFTDLRPFVCIKVFQILKTLLL